MTFIQALMKIKENIEDLQRQNSRMEGILESQLSECKIVSPEEGRKASLKLEKDFKKIVERQDAMTEEMEELNNQHEELRS